MQDERTPKLGLPLPHPDNVLEQDIVRLRQAFGTIDTRLQEIDDGISAEAKARDEAITAAATAQSDAIIASHLPGLISPFSGQFGGTGNKFPIDRRTGKPNLAYAICDGGTYTAPDGVAVKTPDIRDRFIVGASATKAAAATGGAETATSQPTTLTTAQMPQHPHITTAVGYLAADPGGGSYRMSVVAGGGSAGFYSNQITSATAGSSQPHDHSVSTMSPWFALAFIMRL